MLTPEEVIHIREYRSSNLELYAMASEHIRTTCLTFKTQRPQVLRVVFERVPQVKTLESLLAKIELVREKYNPQFSIEDVNDMVALTVLCAYETDVTEFVKWMKTAFNVLTPDQEAIRDYTNTTGHWARHYIITAKSGVASYHFAHVKAELQVKTILQEAFDAKSHDLAYKPKKLKVSQELNYQFALLSKSLNALDGQTEFLKKMILHDKEEVARRRAACFWLYFEQEEVKKTAAALDIDVHNLPDVDALARTIQQEVAKNGPSRGLCKLAALCAIKCDADYLRVEALRHTDAFVKEHPNEARRYLLRGSVKWLIGRSEAAISDVAVAIELGSKQSEDATVAAEAKNNFVYFVADWKAYEGMERENFTALAKTYVEELRTHLDAKTTDTVGMYLIAFGETEDAVDQGRAYLKEANKVRKDDLTYPSFYRLHDFIAIQKLLEMART